MDVLGTLYLTVVHYDLYIILIIKLKCSLFFNKLRQCGNNKTCSITLMAETILLCMKKAYILLFDLHWGRVIFYVQLISSVQEPHKHQYNFA